MTDVLVLVVHKYLANNPQKVIFLIYKWSSQNLYILRLFSHLKSDTRAIGLVFWWSSIESLSLFFRNFLFMTQGSDFEDVLFFSSWYNR